MIITTFDYIPKLMEIEVEILPGHTCEKEDLMDVQDCKDNNPDDLNDCDGKWRNHFNSSTDFCVGESNRTKTSPPKGLWKGDSGGKYILLGALVGQINSMNNTDIL